MIHSARHRNAERLLADLIFAVSPRIDGRAIARRMANRSMCIAPCLESHPIELRHRDGLNENTAQLMAMLPQLARYEATEQAESGDMTRFSGCASYFEARCVGLQHERLQIICLSESGAALFRGPITDGTLDETPLYPRLIVERAFHCHARYVVMCHNHPSGTAFASYADVVSTRSLLRAYTSLGLILLDHIIVADGRGHSMRKDALDEADFIAQAPGDAILNRWFR